MRVSNRVKGISKDLLYSIIGIAVMNGIIQLVIYPYLNTQIGSEGFGDVLTLLSIVAVLGASVGTGANYSRMLTQTKGTGSHSDYNRYMLYAGIVSVLVAIIAFMWIPGGDFRSGLGYYILLLLTLWRYYADVEFRLCLNYRGYCIYYILIAIGYLAGVAVYPITKSWILTFCIGEGIALLYVVFWGSLFKGHAFAKSSYNQENRRSFLQLSATQFLAVVVLHSDRLILQEVCDGTTVTVFYIATLIGKIVSLISTPLNSVLIGYLMKYEGRFWGRTLRKICFVAFPVAVLLSFLCTIVSYGFIIWKYSDLLELARPYLFWANAGQVFYFVSGTLMVFFMRYTDEKYQVYINLAYVIAFFVLAIPMTLMWGLWGMTIAVLLSNVLRIAFICVGSGKVKNNEN